MAFAFGGGGFGKELRDARPGQAVIAIAWTAGNLGRFGMRGKWWVCKGVVPSLGVNKHSNIPMFNRKYMFKGPIFHCYLSLPECRFVATWVDVSWASMKHEPGRSARLEWCQTFTLIWYYQKLHCAKQVSHIVYRVSNYIISWFEKKHINLFPMVGTL